jgi:hypothetical protein
MPLLSFSLCSICQHTSAYVSRPSSGPMCPHTPTCVLILVHTCVLILLYVSSYCYIHVSSYWYITCVLILVYMCAHTDGSRPRQARCVLILLYICVLILLYTCVLILVYMCAHTDGARPRQALWPPPAATTQHTSAYVSIRQHTSAYVRADGLRLPRQQHVSS